MSLRLNGATSGYTEIDAPATAGNNTLTLPAAGTGTLVDRVAAPATATSAGVAGQIAHDTSFFYVCVATNTWRRVAIASW